MKRHAVLFSLIFVLMLGGLSACKKEVGSGDLNAEEQARIQAEQERLRRQMEEGNLDPNSAAGQAREAFVNRDIHFDYDQYDLRPDSKIILEEKAAYVQANPGISVIIEGHCDSRGSYAYNMALGEKRARSAAAYLVALGIPASRIEIVSYGSEMPLISGHSEEAYFANRRGHFIIK
ncbi:MAG: OmpA family protein [Desulfarculales bacterium]|nr:OmpA family protein [Desulfarculales bacterium]